MSDDGERLRKLLDGELSPEELDEDPMLAGLAERIYGEDFLDELGISRGQSKRALTEALSDEEDLDDLMVEVIPEELPSFEPPVLVESTDSSDSTRGGLFGIVSGISGLVLVLVNLFYGFGKITGGCAASVHTSCNENLKLNLLEFHRTAEHIAWSPTGVVGIPDIVVGSLMLVLIVTGFMKRRK